MILGKKMMPVKEVAAHLSISVKAVIRYIKQPNSPLPASKYGNRYYCKPEDVDKFKESCRVITD